jgi:hypothetical protein
MFVKVFGKHNEGAKLGGTSLERCLHHFEKKRYFSLNAIAARQLFT